MRHWKSALIFTVITVIAFILWLVLRPDPEVIAMGDDSGWLAIVAIVTAVCSALKALFDALKAYFEMKKASDK